MNKRWADHFSGDSDDPLEYTPELKARLIILGTDLDYSWQTTGENSWQIVLPKNTDFAWAVDKMLANYYVGQVGRARSHGVLMEGDTMQITVSDETLAGLREEMGRDEGEQKSRGRG